jgi:hypothetical protein
MNSEVDCEIGETDGIQRGTERMTGNPNIGQTRGRNQISDEPLVCGLDLYSPLLP